VVRTGSVQKSQGTKQYSIFQCARYQLCLI